MNALEKTKSEEKKIVYFKGFKAKLTGNVQLKYSKLFNEVIMQEGPEMGQKRWVTNDYLNTFTK